MVAVIERRIRILSTAKILIDFINAWDSREKELTVNEFTLSTHSMHYYNSVLVIEKRKMNPPFAVIPGKKFKLTILYINFNIYILFKFNFYIWR